MALQIRRGTDAERLLITPLPGELIYTTDTKIVYIGDGVTVGGVVIDTAGSGVSNITELGDVSLSSPANGQVLKYNGSTWTNATDETGTTISSINDITDVTLTSPTSGQVLKYNGVAWINDTDLTGGSGISVIGDIPNVNESGAIVGSVLKYDGASWVVGTDLNDGSGTSAINDLTDVSTATPTVGEVLTYDGAVWVNQAPNISDISDLTDVFTATPTVGEVLTYDGAVWVNQTPTTISNISDLTDVFTATPALGEVLTYDGATWVNQEPTISNLADVDITGITVDQSIIWNGLDFVPATQIETSILAGDATVLVDHLTKTIQATTFLGVDIGILTGNSTLSIEKEDLSAGNTSIQLNSLDGVSQLILRRSTAGDLTGNVVDQYGGIFFARNDINGELITSTIFCGGGALTISNNSTGTTGAASEAISIHDGDLGIGTFTPAEKLDVQGNALITGFVQFGNLTTLERDALTAANGMVIYNTTNNKFEGYQNGAWINLDDGLAAS